VHTTDIGGHLLHYPRVALLRFGELLMQGSQSPEFQADSRKGFE
jgi:hypothetical protein